MKKKGIIIVVALLLVAAVLAVVFVFLFKDKNTKSLAIDLNTTVTKEYLSQDSDEYKTIQGYLLQYESMAGEDAVEVTNYRQAYEAYTNIAVFYNQEAAFMNHTKTYSKNRRKIVSALNSAQKSAEKMAKVIKTNTDKIQGSETWQRVVWNNYKEYVEDVVKDSMRAFELMSKVYSASVASNLLNNELTDVMFMGLKHLNTEFKKGVRATANLGRKLLNYSNTIFDAESAEIAVLNFQHSKTLNSESYREIIDIKQKGSKSLHWNDLLNGNIRF